jgi:hypothetical protein
LKPKVWQQGAVFFSKIKKPASVFVLQKKTLAAIGGGRPGYTFEFF